MSEVLSSPMSISVALKCVQGEGRQGCAVLTQDVKSCKCFQPTCPCFCSRSDVSVTRGSAVMSPTHRCQSNFYQCPSLDDHFTFFQRNSFFERNSSPIYFLPNLPPTPKKALIPQRMTSFSKSKEDFRLWSKAAWVWILTLSLVCETYVLGQVT